MHYTLFTFNFTLEKDFLADILSAQLGEIGFESFVTIENGLQAYIQTDNINIKAINQIVSEFDYDIHTTYTKKNVRNKNWNEEWEKNYFKPIIIDELCVIHSSFHTDIPTLKYNIVIDPKMSFGTGHHETTSLMVSEILKMDLKGKDVLDMGCGTSVLGILASKRGAGKVMAIDIDDWCVENSLENIQLNQVKNIEVFLGDATLLEGRKFNIIIANINRNILLQDLKIYAKSLTENGELYMSGFYTEDIPVLENEGKKHDLRIEYSREKNNWAGVKMAFISSSES